MGWCSGTEIFDQMCKVILSEEPIDKKAVIESLIYSLWDGDWDCESDSDYWDNEIVREVFTKLRPEWFEDE